MRLALLAALASCVTGPKPEDVPPGIIDVLEESAVVKTGTVGIKQEKREATYVFVEAKNVTPEDRTVTLEGSLLDDQGTVLGPLAADELRIPAGETRTFALVYGSVAPNGERASFRVRRAAPQKDPPTIVLADLTTEPDGLALAAIARVENKLERTAVATLIATFYDEAGRITARPFVLLELEPKSTRPFRFTGPPGSKTAKVFVGDAIY